MTSGDGCPLWVSVCLRHVVISGRSVVQVEMGVLIVSLSVFVCFSKAVRSDSAATRINNNLYMSVFSTIIRWRGVYGMKNDSSLSR
jgi:hypothetical protein